MRSVLPFSVGLTMLAVSSLPAAAGCSGSGCYQQVVTPPVYATQHHEVLVAPGRRIAHRVPAQYQTVEETVVVRGERQIPHHVPAEYSTVAETFMVSPGGRSWQVSTDAHGRTVGCWVDTPAQYSTRHRQVMVRPASTEYETIPAVTATRARTQLVRPASVEVEVIAPQYQTIARQVMVQPASASWAPISGGRTASSCGGRGLFGSSCGY